VPRALEESIGREVRRLREQRGLTISELAGVAEISGGMLSKIETGSTSPSLSSLQALTRALHIPISALFGAVEPQLRPREGRTGDQHDAYSIAAWLSQAELNDKLGEFFNPSMTPSERTTAQVEGWILGVA